MKKNIDKKGIVLMYAVLTISIVLVITLTMLSFVLKEFQISSSAKDSVQAIYAADAGVECALLWDIRGHEAAPYFGARVFATTSGYTVAAGSGIDCFGGVDLSNTWTTATAGATTTTTFVVDLPDTSCTVVDVEKSSGVTEFTSVFSRGYNVTCGTRNTDITAVERAIKVDYIFN